MSKKQHIQFIALGCVLIGCSGCVKQSQQDQQAPKQQLQQAPVSNINHEITKAPAMIPVPTNLNIETISSPANANAPLVKAGQTAKVHYTGWLWDNGQKGRKFDSSVDRGAPFSFKVGAGQVIAGWDQGLQKMQVGGKYLVTIPAAMGYGARGAGAAIPPNATLLFEVEVLGA